MELFHLNTHLHLELLTCVTKTSCLYLNSCFNLPPAFFIRNLSLHVFFPPSNPPPALHLTLHLPILRLPTICWRQFSGGLGPRP